MRCDGCGRLLGGKGALQCPCWRAVREGATIPARLKERVREAMRKFG